MKLVGVDAPLAAGADASLTERGRNIRSGKMCSVSLLPQIAVCADAHHFVGEALSALDVSWTAFANLQDTLRKNNVPLQMPCVRHSLCRSGD